MNKRQYCLPAMCFLLFGVSEPAASETVITGIGGAPCAVIISALDGGEVVNKYDVQNWVAGFFSGLNFSAMEKDGEASGSRLKDLSLANESQVLTRLIRSQCELYPDTAFVFVAGRIFENLDFTD